MDKFWWVKIYICGKQIIDQPRIKRRVSYGI